MKKMTKQSRYLVYGSLFISGLVIFSTLLLIMMTTRNGGQVNWAIFTGIFILAVGAVALMFYTRKRISYQAKLLNEEFFAEYEKVCDRLQGSVLGFIERRETQKDILGLFIDAQNSGRTVVQVTGGDTEAFVKKVQDSFGYRNKFIFLIISGIQFSIMYLFMIQLYVWLKAGGSFFEAEGGYDMMVLLLPVAFIGVPLMRQFIWKQKILWAFVVPVAILAVDVAFMEITWANFMHLEWVRAIHEVTFPYIPNMWFLVMWVGILGATYGIMWIMRIYSVKKL